MRKYLVMASASVLALAVTVGAASASTVTSGTIIQQFDTKTSPASQEKSKRGGVKLFVQTSTKNVNGTPFTSGTESVAITLDKDYKVNASKFKDKCDPAKISGGSVTVATATAACGKAKIGSGLAHANTQIPSLGVGGIAAAPVVAFLGSGPDEILLFTSAQLSPTTVLSTIVKGDVSGNKINIKVDDLPAGGTLIDFNVSLSKKTTTGSGKNKKTNNLIEAKCSKKSWTNNSVWTFRAPQNAAGAPTGAPAPGPVTVPSKQKCKQKS